MIDTADGEDSDMGAAEDGEVVRRGYEAFIAGDLATLGELFADDAVWSVPGTGVLSGMKRGRDAVLAYFGELGSRSRGSLRVTVQDIVGGEKHTVGIHHSHADIDGRTYDQVTVVVFALRDGKVIEAKEFFEDQTKSDEFWG
ncbi:nuclear transport factor 2 family protein [Arthrobacter antioxidans]|uniref:nuclear transport factor 2 family protein n=1 Tax=Arthrobacter antioxidans TaxID=2895818 RepID=UPI001FFF613C|nr:nuclear transport factor 2 family protein [Arthrobacter antioxidans]